MVFFACNACGESIKKAQVEKHVNMCRGCQVLSCMDCGNDFWGENYKNHIKCITEDQKYGGKGYDAKSNKGDVKQQQWIQKIHDAMNEPGISSKFMDVLHQVSSYDNVPRKKVKFQNWMSNSLRITNQKLQNQVWDICSAATSNAPETAKPKDAPHYLAAEIKTETDMNPQVLRDCKVEELVPGKKKLNKLECKEQRRNGKNKRCPEENDSKVPDETAKSKNERREKGGEEDAEQSGDKNVDEEIASKKRKLCRMDTTEEDQIKEMTNGEDSEVSRGKFNWKGTIKAVLRQYPNKEFSVKKLRKKVLAAYCSFSGEGHFKSEEDLLALFNKKINRNPKFIVLNNKIRLIE